MYKKKVNSGFRHRLRYDSKKKTMEKVELSESVLRENDSESEEGIKKIHFKLR